MAFQAPSAGQEKQNRKIMEQLEEQKKKLRMQSQTSNSSSTLAGTTTTATATATASIQSPVTQTTDSHMSPQQRAALQHAHTNSVGFFITQDSSFGNLILPVLPRFEQ